MKRKRLVHIVTRLCHGGAANVLATLGKYLDRDSFEVILLHGSVNKNETDATTEITPFFDEAHFIKPLQRDVHIVRDFNAFQELKKKLTQIKPDLIHTHTSKAGILGRCAARSLGIPVCHSTHGHIFGESAAIPGVNGWSKKLFLQVEKHVSRHTQKIFTLSVAEIDDWVAMRVASIDQYQMLPSPVEVDRIERGRHKRHLLREQHQLDDDDWVSVHVGRLASEKGHRDLLEAFDESIRGQLWIVGDGPLKKDLMEFAEKRNLQKRVKFLGHRQDLHDWLAAVDALILPSTYEGQGLVLVEAMAAGVPVIATDVGGIPEVIAHGVSGLLVSTCDPISLRKAWVNLQKDPHLKETLIAGGDQCVKKYDPFLIAAQLKDHYLEMIN